MEIWIQLILNETRVEKKFNENYLTEIIVHGNFDSIHSQCKLMEVEMRKNDRTKEIQCKN